MVVVTYLASTIVLALTNNRNTTNTLTFIIVMSFVAGSLAGALVMGGVSIAAKNEVSSNRSIPLDLPWIFKLGANQVSNHMLQEFKTNLFIVDITGLPSIVPSSSISQLITSDVN